MCACRDADEFFVNISSTVGTIVFQHWKSFLDCFRLRDDKSCVCVCECCVSVWNTTCKMWVRVYNVCPMHAVTFPGRRVTSPLSCTICTGPWTFYILCALARMEAWFCFRGDLLIMQKLRWKTAMLLLVLLPLRLHIGSFRLSKEISRESPQWSVDQVMQVGVLYCWMYLDWPGTQVHKTYTRYVPYAQQIHNIHFPNSRL